MKYYTHAGLFHCDEVAGYAICWLADICDDFERLTNINNLPTDGLIADIGREYDPAKLRFDHHQGLILRHNGYPYASAGLLWKEYGSKAVANVLGGNHAQSYLDKIVQRVDERLIQGIDAHDADNAYSVSAECVGGAVNVVTLPMLISSYNGEDIKDEESQNTFFIIASGIFENHLEKEIKSADKYFQAVDKFDNLATIEGEIIILSEFVDWREIVADKYPDAKFVISPSAHPGNPYSLTAVAVSAYSRTVKIPIDRPDWFKGFIHQGRWIAGGESVEVLTKLANYNLLF